jgi:hypothetical protein
MGMLLVCWKGSQWIVYNESDLEVFRPKVWEIVNIQYIFDWILNKIFIKNSFK